MSNSTYKRESIISKLLMLVLTVAVIGGCMTLALAKLCGPA